LLFLFHNLFHLIENHFQITKYQHLFLPRSYSILPMTDYLILQNK
jgi:hypothetical protein